MRQRSLLLVLGVSGALSVTGCGDHNDPAMEDEGMRRAEYTPTTGDEQGVDVHAQTETRHQGLEDPSMDTGLNPAPGGATPDPWAMEGVGEPPTTPGSIPGTPPSTPSNDPLASVDFDDTPTPDEGTANLEAEYRDAEGTLFRVGPVSARDPSGAGNEPGDPSAMTATSNQLPEGTIVRVERVDVPGSAVIVRIESGETTADAILQLSQAAADRIGVRAPDTADARIVILEDEASRTASAEPMPSERGDRTASASPTPEDDRPEDDRTASADVPRRSPANR